jgi:tetratricopeptide (TPR) repeat protein
MPSLFAPTHAHGASHQGQERAARKACLNGDYAKGVSILSDLFLDTKDPNYIFNQGRCFEQNRRFEEAIARFEEYLRAATDPKQDKADRASAERHVADCKDRLAQAGRPITATVTPPQPSAPTPAPSAAVLPVQVIHPQPASASRAGMRTAGIITASVGGAALIAGVVFNLKVNSMASDMETTPGGYSAGRESDRKTYQTLGWVSYGVGAACVATGAVLYVFGLRLPRGSTPSVALLPAFAPGQTGALLKGAF